MDLLDSVQIVLWSTWTHLLFPLLGAFSISILVGLVAYFLAKVRARREMKMQKLKAHIARLKEELGSIQAMAATLAIELDGVGPFELPLLTEFDWLVPTEQNGLKVGFRSESGNRIYAGISHRAIAQLVNDRRAFPLSQETLSPLTLIDLTKPADAHILPVLARLEGHFERGQNEWILVFSSEDGRKILLPLSSDSYEQLLTQSKATLLSHQEENWLKEIIPRLVT